LIVLFLRRDILKKFDTNKSSLMQQTFFIILKISFYDDFGTIIDTSDTKNTLFMIVKIYFL